MAGCDIDKARLRKALDLLVFASFAFCRLGHANRLDIIVAAIIANHHQAPVGQVNKIASQACSAICIMQPRLLPKKHGLVGTRRRGNELSSGLPIGNRETVGVGWFGWMALQLAELFIFSTLLYGC